MTDVEVGVYLMLTMSTVGGTVLMLRTDSALANNSPNLGRYGMYQYGGKHSSLILCGRSLATGIKKGQNDRALLFEVFSPCSYLLCRTGRW